MPNAVCKSDNDCKEGQPFPTGNGVQTGKCVNSTQEKDVKTCEIYAWCPVEVDEPPM